MSAITAAIVLLLAAASPGLAREPASPAAGSAAAELNAPAVEFRIPAGELGGESRARRSDSGPAFVADAPSSSDRQLRAAAATVEIRDFLYEPALITVGVGEAVRWTNFDEAEHSATVFEGGALDTGLLARNESGSVRVDEAGTYEYICSLHPEMEGTLVVEREPSGGDGGSDDSGSPNGDGDGGGSDGGGSGDGEDPATASGGTGSTSGASASGSLPTTGLELIWPLACAALLMAAGFLLLALERALGPPTGLRTKD